jgi:hypothetical protein
VWPFLGTGFLGSGVALSGRPSDIVGESLEELSCILESREIIGIDGMRRMRI